MFNIFTGVKVMKCFVHIQEEAVAACRKCGKGMCANCSAYSGHSGVCPECRKKEFEKEVSRLSKENHNLKWEIFKAAAGTILLCWTIIFGIINGVKWHKRVKLRDSNEARIAKLKTEIDKLNNVLVSRGTGEFI